MKKKKVVKILFAIILIVLFGLLFVGVKNIYDTLNTEGVKTLSTIEGYNYNLNENDSPYFKKLFKKLQETLTQEEVDEEEYAKLISQMFVVDFYSLEYVTSRNDVGGIQFVYADSINDFTKKAKDTIYLGVESNVYGKRKQELPNVKEVEVDNIKTESYQGQKVSDEKAYYVDLKIEYDENLGYDEKASLVIIHKDNKLEIVKVN